MADLGRRHVARLPKLDRIRQHIALLNILIHPGVRLHRPEGLGAEVATVCGEAEEAGLLAELTDGIPPAGWLHYMRWGGFPRAQAHALHIMELVRKLPAPQNLEALASSARCLALLEVHMPETRVMFDELAAYGPAAAQLLHFQWGLGLVRRWEGDVEGAREALKKGRSWRAVRATCGPNSSAWPRWPRSSWKRATPQRWPRSASSCDHWRASLATGARRNRLVETLTALAAASTARQGARRWWRRHRRCWRRWTPSTCWPTPAMPPPRSI